MTIEEFLEKQKTHPELRVEISLKDWQHPRLFVVDRANEICSWFDVLSPAHAYTFIVRLNREGLNPVELERHGQGAVLLLEESRCDFDRHVRFVRD